MGFINLEDGLMANVCKSDRYNQNVHASLNKIKINRKRYVIMTADKQEIFVGIARNMHFRKLDDIRDIYVKTYVTEKKAKSSFLQSWSGSDEEDFNEGGKYIIVPIMETLTEI